MKLVTRDSDYAIRALLFIVKKRRKIVTASELVKELKVSRPFLRKILQVLNKKGIFKSYKGVGGGFQLAMKPDEIFLLDVMKIFQGKFRLNECLLNKHICPNIKKCPLRKKIVKIEKYVFKELKSITIAGLLS